MASARPAFSPAPRRVLRHDVLDSLHARILNGQLPPGTRLLEVGLSQRLGVSRGPVREAIRQLEQQGLVEFFPHRGAIVVGVADDEVGPIYDVRAVLEARAFARAARSVTPADIAELNALIDAMVRALDRRDYGSIVDLDLAFHGRVVALSGFRLLRQVWASIDSLVRGQTRLDLDLVSGVRPELSHRELVDGLSSGRPSLAANAARRHIQDASGRLRRAGRQAPQRSDRSRVSR